MKSQNVTLLIFFCRSICINYCTNAFVNSASAYCLKDHRLLSTQSTLRGGWSLASVAVERDSSSTEQPYYPNLPEALLQKDKDAVEVAIRAVVKACQVSYGLQPSNTNGGISTITKKDLSPVTVADYAVQAIVLQHLYEKFPNDEFVAEEDAIQLEEDNSLAEQVLHATGMSGLDELCRAVNLGQGKESNEGPAENHKKDGTKRRVWCLDPIDGTRGFLRGKEQGGQFCVALALLEDGVPVIGILGCPNLAWSLADDVQEAIPKGCLFVAVKGAGCYQLPLFDKSLVEDVPQKLMVTPPDGSARILSKARMCVGVEKYSDARGLTARMAHLIHHPTDQADRGVGQNVIPNARRVDSQVKYGLIARGDGEFYVRLPKIGYQEWIWDHAAGSVVLEEAGGIMTDTEGNPIDFSLGRQLSASIKGILGSNGGLFHQALLDSYRRAEDELLASEKDS